MEKIEIVGFLLPLNKRQKLKYGIRGLPVGTYF